MFLHQFQIFLGLFVRILRFQLLIHLVFFLIIHHLSVSVDFHGDWLSFIVKTNALYFLPNSTIWFNFVPLTYYLFFHKVIVLFPKFFFLLFREFFTFSFVSEVFKHKFSIFWSKFEITSVEIGISFLFIYDSLFSVKLPY